MKLFGALVVSVSLVILSGSSVTVWASADAPTLAKPQVRAATRAKVRIVLPSLYELPPWQMLEPLTLRFSKRPIWAPDLFSGSED
jgi:hypothetical protein